MHFATPIPLWLAVLAAAALVALAFVMYRRPLAPLTRIQHGTLIALRAAALLFLFALICRPIIELPPVASGGVVVPVLLDVSRSMRIEDANGGSRLAQAADVVKRLTSALSTTARVEVFTFADRLAPAGPLDQLTTDGRRTDLSGAIAAARSRYRGQRVPGLVVVSDGGNTATSDAVAVDRAVPVFTIGVGSVAGVADREVTGLTAGDPRFDQAAADLLASIAAHGAGREPFDVKVLADGQVVDAHHVTPSGDNTPIEERFTVYPDATRATLFTARVDAAPGEAVTENNERSLAVSPAGRQRRVLILSGAPGFEHSFLMRALQQDPGFDVDSIVRKGKNDANVDTFLVQAGGDRSASLLNGFPPTRETLFIYDAVVVSNMEADFFTRDQLASLAAFVGERGGGLLVMGGRTFERRGLTGTALEEVLPLELTDRRSSQARGAVAGDEGPTGRDTIALTDDGVRHPIMRIGSEPDQLRRLWSTLPPLASTAPVGGPRPGASVLAVTAGGNGAVQPVIAVQKYGRGRSMIFAGEASWRWRMLQPSTDRRYDFFWRQSLRWLSADTPEPVALTLPGALDAGDDFAVQIDVRDKAFAPVDGASVDVRLTNPSGQVTALAVRAAGRGHASASGTVAAPGLYRVQADARKNGLTLGADDRWIAVGDNEREFADPRLNEALLQRLARESGGEYVPASDVTRLSTDLLRTVPALLQPQQRDLWHEPWTFAIIVLLLSAEWTLRRWWGLR